MSLRLIFSKELFERLQKIRASGLNIYALINTYKKRTGMTRPIPESILFKVCDQFDQYTPQGDPWPYFFRVLTRAIEEDKGRSCDEVNPEGQARIKELVSGVCNG